MKILSILLMSIFTTIASAQVSKVIDQFKYDRGLKVKSKGLEVDGMLWSNIPDGNKRTLKRIDLDNELNDEVEIVINYDGGKKRKRISSIQEVVSQKDGEKTKIEKVFSTHMKSGTFLKSRIQEASVCNLIEEGKNEGKYDCQTVNIPFCRRLNMAINGSLLGKGYLKKCADSLQRLNTIISDKSYNKKLQNTNAHKMTLEKIKKGNIAVVNGGIIGSNIAEDAEVSLNSIIKLRNVCNDNNLLDNYERKSKSSKPKESQSQESVNE